MSKFPTVYRKWLLSAMMFLIVAAFLGFLLRVAFLIELPIWFKYKNIQHAHSHIAMMGWLTACLYMFICMCFEFNNKSYSRLFWISQFIVLALLFSFIIQGYKFISILFSVFFIIVNYLFIYKCLNDIKAKYHGVMPLSAKLLKASLFFLGFSSLGIWAMGPIMVMSLKGSAIYYSMVQFYLHFQFNGWFIFVMLALVVKVFEDNSIRLDIKKSSLFYRLMFISCFLTYALSVTWSTPLNAIFWLNSAGVIMQGIALIYFLRMINEIRTDAQKMFSKVHFRLWGITFFLFSFKVLIQTFVSIPYLAKVSYTIHNFVIGFVHLLMLGVLCTFIFGLLEYKNLFKSYAGIIIFITGVFLTEALLFGQGLLLWLGMGFIPYYYLIIVIFSALLFLGAAKLPFDLIRKN